jgi:acyl-CoA dehydrogenase
MSTALETLRREGPSPAAESAALGEWLLARAGFEPRAGLVTAAEERGGGTLPRVAFGRAAEWVVVLDGQRARLLARQDLTVREGVNLAGEPRDTLVLGTAGGELGDVVGVDALRLRGALVRAVLMAGGLERIAEIAIAYAGERRQFGRPIASFQAVQEHLVNIAQQAALVGVAADAAMASQAAFEIAAAKLLAGRAAVTASRAAHQVLGALGVTFEHPLSTETKQLWSWRTEFGGEREWAERLGTAAANAGADQLYLAITDGSNALDV